MDGKTGVACLKDSYGNGAGFPLNSCGEKEMEAGLCYNKCKEGYKGVGPVCWKSCPAGWKDTGVACLKDSYGNGAGEPLNYCGDKEMDAGLCYNKCPGGYKGVGPVCWATCPAGWKDIGVACEKDSYANGSGRLPTVCPNNQDFIDGKCYDKCPAGFERKGTSCFSKCPEGFTDTDTGCVKQQPLFAKMVCMPNQQLIDGVCYEACPTNYVLDSTGLKCVSACPENWKLMDGKCVKDVVSNVAEEQKSLCPVGYEMRNNLCYPKCETLYPFADREFCYRYNIPEYAKKVPGLY